MKMFEHIIHHHLVSALERHHLLTPSQSGFRIKRSTVTLLTEAVYDWSLCLEQRNTVHCLLLDFAKAFDSVPHERLLLKLSSLGINGQVLSWLRSFLTSRKQRVVINGVLSDWANVTSGVPQGTVLGPLLLLLYVNDLDSIIKNSTIKLLLMMCYFMQECCALQDELHAISNWAKHWQLNLKIGKCKALAITNKRRPVKFSYYINGQPILWNNPVKYLSLLVDGKLTWSKHCRYAISKATKSLNCRHCSIFGCSREAKCAAYKTIVRPTVEYAAVAWCPHYNCDTKLIESLQNRAARWICGSYWSPPTNSWTTSSNDCCSQLNLPTLQSRHQYLSILSSVIFTIIIPPSISAITVISTVFLLPEVIICHYVHLNQPLTLGDVPFLLILSFGGSLSLYTSLMIPTASLFGILCTILFVLMIR